LRKTLANRPDLLATAELSDADRAFLASLDEPQNGFFKPVYTAQSLK
jgi:hypothetical protein